MYNIWLSGYAKWLCENDNHSDIHNYKVFSVFNDYPSQNQRLLWAAHGWMFPFASVSKRVFVQNLSHKNELMNLYMEVIWMFLPLDSFWHRGKRQLGNGLLDECRKRSWIKKREEELIIVELFLVLQWKTGKETSVGQMWWIGFDVQIWLFLTPFRWLNSFSGKIVLK